MLFGVGTSYIGNSNTLAVVDGLLLHRGRRVTSLTNVVYVACRGIKVVAVSSAGAVYFFRFVKDGVARFPRLRSTGESYTPEIRIPLYDVDIRVVAVSMGRRHFIVLFNDGTIGGSGLNGFGCLGIEPTTPPQSFAGMVRVGGGDLEAGSATGVAACEDSSAAVNRICQPLFLGSNHCGQFGLGHKTNSHSWTLNDWGLGKVVTLDIEDHCMLVMRDGSMMAAGSNSYGQLGLGDLTDRHVFALVDVPAVGSVSCGGRCTVIVDKKGQVHMCGYQLDSSMEIANTFRITEGLPTMAQVVVANGRGVALSREGEAFEWGPYASGTRPLDLPHDSDLPPTMIFTGVSLEARAPQPLSAARALMFHDKKVVHGIEGEGEREREIEREK